MFKQNKNKKWTPPDNYHTINTYVELVKKDIEQSKTFPPKKIRSHLSKDENVALKDLSKQDDIIVTNADKGGAVVTMDVNYYIREAKRQLNEPKNFKVLAKDPTKTNNDLINQTIDRFSKEQLINDNITNGLKNPSPTTPQFYISSKIHKEGNPGRVMISSINCHTANISKYVDYYLQPIVKQIPSYVKGTKDFINKINAVKSVPKNSYLVTMGLRSLYTNIPNTEGISVVKRAFYNYSKKTTSTKVITTFLALILTLNNFVFNCIHYLQIKVCAMGTICSPAYANISMLNFKLKYIYPYIKNKAKMFLRFTDNLFMIWTGSEQELLDFMSDLNKKHSSIKFEFKYSQRKIEFLDVLFCKDHNNMHQTTIYRKQTDRQNYLDARSEHSTLLKDSIPYSQSLRIKRICSSQQEFLNHTAKMINQFQKSGYDRSLIEQQINKSNLQGREQLLKAKKKETATNIPLSLKYNRTLPKIKEIVMKPWNLLHIKPNLAEIFQNPPILAFRRNKNLRDIIGTKFIENGNIKRKFTNRIRGKCTPCLANNRTQCCEQILHTTTFRSNQMNRIFHIYHNLNCKSKYVIYLLECTKCKIQYVGKAQTEFKIRLNNHPKDVWKPDAIPASRNFSDKNHSLNSHAKFMLTEQIRHVDINTEKINERLKQRENFWILTLETLTPK